VPNYKVVLERGILDIINEANYGRKGESPSLERRAIKDE